MCGTCGCGEGEARVEILDRPGAVEALREPPEEQARRVHMEQDLLAATRGSVASNLVEVYKALGGGWEIRADQDPVDRLPAAMKDEMRERTRAWKGVLQ